MKTKILVIALVLIAGAGIWLGLNSVETSKSGSTDSNTIQSVNSSNNQSSGQNGTTSNKVEETSPLIDDQCGIQVGVIWEKQSEGSSTQAFQISINNHMVNLDDFDPTTSVKLLLNDKEIPASVTVLKKSGAGHHVSVEISAESQKLTQFKKGGKLSLKIINPFDTPTRDFSWVY